MVNGWRETTAAPMPSVSTLVNWVGVDPAPAPWLNPFPFPIAGNPSSRTASGVRMSWSPVSGINEGWST